MFCDHVKQFRFLTAHRKYTHYDRHRKEDYISRELYNHVRL